MKRKRLPLVILWSLLVMVLPAGFGFAQGDQTKASEVAVSVQSVTIKGTIAFDERRGGYFIRGVEPAGELYVIVNQNKAVLRRLRKSGKTVTIEGGTSERAAEHFFIEKIDGKTYSAEKPSSSKQR
jgi:hypothetical protein